MAREKNSKRDDRSAAAIGFGIATAAVAASAFLLSRSSRRHPKISTDAPHWTLDKSGKGSRPVVGKTLLINAKREALFKAWQKVEDFPRFMENVERVERTGDRSEWTVKAPGGKTVKLVNRVTETVAGESISWQSEADSDIANSGKVSFEDAPAGRGTYVSLVMSYDPPGGTLGRIAAKVLQREPAIQARRDLRRFKQMIETGEVTTNASPSGRKSESPTEARI